MASKRKPEFRVGQRVVITHCEGVIVSITPFTCGARGSMLHVRVGGVSVPCYREEVRPLTKKEGDE